MNKQADNMLGRSGTIPIFQIQKTGRFSKEWKEVGRRKVQIVGVQLDDADHTFLVRNEEGDVWWIPYYRFKLDAEQI